ncbi:MAG TPA: O-antigen ligase family protein [Thermoanaerobaculia bacterium]|nr:O-antigen ligase family protein [Thermoanaerobaculia bacterium]
MPSDLSDRERHSGDAHRRSDRTVLSAKAIALRLGLPADLPPAVRYAALFYLAHILCLGWNAITQIFLGLAIIAAGLAVRKRQLSIPFHPLYLPLLVYCIATTISHMLRPNPWDSRLDMSEWFYFLAFPLGITLLGSISNLFQRSVGALIAVATFLSGYGLVQYFLLGYHEKDIEKRITASLSHVMTFSGMMVAMSLLLILLAFLRRDRLTMTAAAMTSAALMVTFTRGAWIGWSAGLLVVLLQRRARWVFYLLPAVILAVTFSPLALFARLVSTFDLQQASNLDRIRMVQAGAGIIADYPLFGVGPSNIKEIYPLYRSTDAPRFVVPHLHNNLVQIWAERGLFALIGYLMILAIFLRSCLSVRGDDPERRRWADIGVAVTVALTVAGAFEYNFGDSEVLFTTLVVFVLVTRGIEGIHPPGQDSAVSGA